MSKEAMKLALENSQPSFLTPGWTLVRNEDITALREALAKPDFWEGYVPEPVKPAQQCKWPTCQSEEYQQALAEQIKRELVGEQPAQRTWEEWFKWWRTSKVADSTEAEIDFADFMLIVRAVEAEYGIKENP